VVEAVCAEAAGEEVVAPANDNTPKQIVISGHRAAVERASVSAKERGARYVKRLPVSAPFHCQLMKPAEIRLAKAIQEVDFRDLRFPLVNNADTREVVRGEEARAGLIRQVCAMVRWSGGVRAMARLGVDTFVEVGPGKVLTGLIRRTVSEVHLSSIENTKQVEEHVRTG
jgi:[acyl-carrier-protein] S-malonyltransferase